MLKSVVLAALLATVGGLSLQPALAQGVQAQRSAEFGSTVQSDALSAMRPQGEHVRVNSSLNEGTDASGAATLKIDYSGNVCAEATSDCTQTSVDDNAGTVREKNDVNRRDVGSPRSSGHPR